MTRFNLVSYLARRLDQNRKESDNNKVRIIVQIAIGSIAVSVAAMILAVFIVRGFQEEIRNKVILFDAHLRIGKFDLYQNISNQPISKHQEFVKEFKKHPHITHIQVFAEKPSIIKTKTDVQGVLLKGIDQDFNVAPVRQKMVEGRFFDVKDTLQKNSIVIGQGLAHKLNLKLGQKVRFYFMEDPIRVRVFKISGIFKTGMGQMDNYFVFVPISHIQILNDWNKDMVSGFEVFLSSYNDIHDLDSYIYENIGYDLNTLKIMDKYPEIFGWLNLLDTNVGVVLIFALLVSLVNMISTLFIIVLDKTNTIGLFKVFGATNMFVMRVFFNLFTRFLWRGMLIGNFLALLFCLLQYYFKVITLPEETYYISYVPVKFEWFALILINVMTFLSCFLAYLIPALILSKIKPIETVKFN